MESEIKVELIDKPVAVELVGQKSKRNIVPVISLLLSAVSFVLTIWPALNLLNRNYEQRALSGHIKSQMYLADYNYQIGEYKKSIYYYNMIADRDNLITKNQKECFTIACNNLAYLFAKELDSPDHFDIAKQYLERAIDELNKDYSLLELIGYNYLLVCINSEGHSDRLRKIELWYLGDDCEKRLERFKIIKEEGPRKPKRGKGGVSVWNSNDSAAELLYSYSVITDYSDDSDEYVLLDKGYYLAEILLDRPYGLIPNCPPTGYKIHEKAYIATGLEDDLINKDDWILYGNNYFVYRKLPNPKYKYYSYINHIDTVKS